MDSSINQEAIRAAKAHLDSSFDFFMKMVPTKTDQRSAITNAQLTIGKASKILFEIACSAACQEKRSDENRRGDRSLSDSRLPPALNDNDDDGAQSTSEVRARDLDLSERP